ncbi:MAG TPA: MoxR family ATPase [Bacteroidia bacterium]|jgi:MoxR-like ATPase|nr:MoxR family ATPase [Bacteroidia bacterium]
MEEQTFSNRVDLAGLQKSVEDIKTEISKIIVGQEQMIELLIASILANGHVLIEGVPGVAKTLTAKLLSKTLAVEFSRIQFTPDLMPSDIIGTSIFNLKTSEFEYKKGPLFSNVVLIDEINRAPAKTQSALFEAMEERQITVDGKTYPLAPPFIVIATQNPVEQEGTYRLPEAQLDRFLVKIQVDYPSLEEETKLLTEFHARKNTIDLGSINTILNASKVEEYRNAVSVVHIESNLIAYIVKLVHQTRESSALYLGASPRASIAILSMSKAIAAMHGRDFVNPDDIKSVIAAVLRHRVILTPEKEMEGITTNDVIKQLIEQVEVPR